MFDKKRQVYTFNTYCEEDKNLKLNDETTKIFISTKNKKDKNLNVNLEELINFINGKVNRDNVLIDKIVNEIEEIKNREEWRVEYMLSVLNYSDARREGRREGYRDGHRKGRREGRREGEYIGERRGEAQKTVNSIKSFVDSFNMSIEQVMEGLKIPTEEQGLYYKLVNDPVFYEKYFADESNFIDSSDYKDEEDDEEE